MKKTTSTIVKGSLLMLIGIGIKVLMDFVFSAVISRIYGAKVLGAFTIANTIFNILAIISVAGLNLTLSRFLPIIKKSKERLSILIGTSLKYTFLISLLSSLMIFIFSSQISEIFRSTYIAPFLRVLMIGLPLFALMRIFVSITTAFENAKYEAIIEKSILPVVSTISIVAFIAVDKSPNAIPLSILIAYILGFSISLALTTKYFAKSINFGVSIGKFDKKYLFFSMPLFLNNLIIFLTLWVDNLLLAYFLSEDQVGIYSISKKIGSLPLITINAFNIVFLPTISRIINNKQQGLAKSYYKDAVRILTIVAFPITTFLTVFSSEILTVFGKEFEKGNIALLLIGIGTLLNIASGPIGKLLIAYNKQKVIIVSTIVAFLISSIFSFILIPRYGLIGAGISFIIGEFLQNYLGIFYLAFNKKGLHPYSRKNAYLLISISAFLILTILTREVITNIFAFSNAIINNLAMILLSGIICFTIYVALAYTLKIYKQKDIILLKELIKKIKK